MRKKTNCLYCGAQLSEKLLEGTVRLFCESCREPVYENPVPATCLVVVDDKKRLFLVKRSVEPKKGFWCLPGGFMELGETPEQGALRELKEETDLTGHIGMLLGVTSNHSDKYNTVLMIGYLIENYIGTPKAGDDASDIACFDFDNLPEVAFESHKKFIRIYLSAYVSKQHHLI
ncbi:MAG: NUDIX hydrolase [Desulfobacterales bacterium]|nr:NUDIX hydrolase [Desulfobacterales bacterium]MDX2508209.1 NUDIX hydrolase [Desulfobacterales bacterium]